MIRQQVLFFGRVQGVFFRATTAELAGKLPLSGWVRNLPDGSVELQVQGDGQNITVLLEQIASHYDGHISDRQVREMECDAREAGFRVRH